MEIRRLVLGKWQKPHICKQLVSLRQMLVRLIEKCPAEQERLRAEKSNNISKSNLIVGLFY
nr:MAG TPA: hypothetical protein [Caudoviricetes sp.]